MSVWTKTPRGWVLREADYMHVETMGTIPNAIKLNVKRTVNDRSVSQGRVVIVTGMKGQRRLSLCVSEFIEHIDLQSAVTDVRRKEYLFDMMLLFMKHSLNKISGAAQRQLFRILESMLNEAFASQNFLHRMKELLAETMKAMTGESVRMGRIGSNSLWNRHLQTVANLCTKMEQHKQYEREDDGEARITDLPKECVREIILRLPDHRDVMHLGQTCLDMHDMVDDSSIWEKLVKFHFNDKQVNTFIEDTDCLSSTSLWQSLHQKCYRKYGLRKTYADQLVICSACKTLHWMMNGHHCWIADERTQQEAWLEPVSPDELFSMLFYQVTTSTARIY